jgi:hypothetical protein
MIYETGCNCRTDLFAFTSFATRPIAVNALTLTAFIMDRKGDDLSVKLILTNHSADTIKYMSWSCSWEDCYSVDNEKWHTSPSFCFKNGREIIAIPPFKSETKILWIVKTKGIGKSKNYDFRIGFHYVSAPLELKTLPIKVEMKKSGGTMIWSSLLVPGYSSGK